MNLRLEITLFIIFVIILFGINLTGCSQEKSLSTMTITEFATKTITETQTIIKTPVTPSPTLGLKDNWKVSGLTYKITEKCETWWKFSWQLTLKNNTSYQMQFFVTVNFLDKDGFIIEDDLENPNIFNPLEQRVIKGYALIDTEIALDVKGIEAKIEAYKVY